jgi:hypothetical protein
MGQANRGDAALLLEIEAHQRLGRSLPSHLIKREATMSALVRHVALVSESSRAQMPDLLRVSAALQKQASRDLAPILEISATADAFEKLEDVPDGYWPMIVKDNIGYDAAGIHMDNDNQPFALISAADSLDEWSLTASHEMCEMLVDPSGDRQMTSDSPMSGQGRVSFLGRGVRPVRGL